ncbi:MAG: MurR/RpiR family transcriptional regulator [Candidatus Fimivivens sp.]
MRETLQRIHEIYPNLTRAKKTVANYFLKNYKDIPFKTVTTLAAEIGVSDTTIINLCTELGFDGFTSFKRTAKEYVQATTTFNKFSANADSMHGDGTNIIDLILNQEFDNIYATLSNEENRKNFYKLIEMIQRAEKIYILGFRSSAVMAQLLGFNFRQQALPVKVITPDIGDCIDKIIYITQKDLVIAFTFARYSTDVLLSLKALKNRGVSIVGITDFGLSQCYQYSDFTFQCQTKSNTYVNSYSSCLSLICEITTLSALSRKEQTTKLLKELEDMFTLFETFENEVYFK